ARLPGALPTWVAATPELPAVRGVAPLRARGVPHPRRSVAGRARAGARRRRRWHGEPRGRVREGAPRADRRREPRPRRDLRERTGGLARPDARLARAVRVRRGRRGVLRALLHTWRVRARRR